jgi:glycosyltransferase involved in cell wall biosynthesis
MGHLRGFWLSPVRYCSALALALHHRTPGLKSLALALAYFVEAIVFAMELRHRGITHVHNHFANPSAIVTYLATHYLKIPFSLTLHGNSETDYPAGLLLGQKLHQASFGACVSYYGRAQACRTIPASDWAKLPIVRCGLDLTHLPLAADRQDDGPNRSVRLICVARLSAEKGHAGLIQAYALARRCWRNSELVLVGDGPMRAALERQIDELGLTDCVKLLGALPEDVTLIEIAKSDVLVLASFIEGLPVCLIEAMALGKPVIAPHVAGIPEIIQDGYNGLLFSPSDWTGLMLALRELLKNDKLCARLSRAGRNTIADEFDIRQAVVPLIEWFRVAHGEVAPVTESAK